MKESFKENYKDIEFSKGDTALNRGEFNAAYIHYVQEGNVEGLYKVAKKFEDEGNLEKSAEALAEAFRIKELDK